MRDLVAELWRIGRFTPIARYQRFAYVCAGLLIVSGLFHSVVYLVDGGSLEGPVSWRKPIVFGLSFGITLMTVTWLMNFLRPKGSVGRVLLGILAVASVGEVFLISMQRWRGVESHFNEDTNFDAMVFALMGILVGLVALVIVAITVLAFVRLDAPASLAFAVRVGLVLMLVSQVVGFQMIVEGGNTFGDRGALKVPHAFTLHAVQVLVGLALLLHQGSGNRRCWLHRVDLLDHGADVLRSKPTRPRHTGINTRPARLGTPGGERRSCVAGGCHARKSAGAGTGSHRRASQPLSTGRTSTSRRTIRGQTGH